MFTTKHTFTQISTRVIASIPKYKRSYTCTITLFL